MVATDSCHASISSPWRIRWWICSVYIWKAVDAWGCMIRVGSCRVCSGRSLKSLSDDDETAHVVLMRHLQFSSRVIPRVYETSLPREVFPKAVHCSRALMCLWPGDISPLSTQKAKKHCSPQQGLPRSYCRLRFAWKQICCLGLWSFCHTCHLVTVPSCCPEA